MLDLYRPKHRSTGLLPAIVVIRGGGWRMGDKEGFGHIAAALSERGLAAVSIEYRTSREAHFPAAIHDTKAAVRWLRSNAARYSLDLVIRKTFWAVPFLSEQNYVSYRSNYKTRHGAEY